MKSRVRPLLFAFLFSKFAKGSAMEKSVTVAGDFTGNSMENVTGKMGNKKRSNVFATSLVTTSLLGILGFGILGLGTLGCSTQTNPTSEYPELADYVPKGERPPAPTLEFIDPRYFPIETCQKAAPVDTCGYINFVEGRADTYYFKPRLMLSGVQYELTALNLPEGAAFARAGEPDRAGQYVLTWTPSAGTIADTQVDRSYKFQIRVKVLNQLDPKAAALMKKIGSDREMEMRLVRTDEQPVITKITNAKNEVVDMKAQVFNEGEGARSYNVIVRDVGAYAGEMPYLYVRRERNSSQESAKIDGSQFVKEIGEPKSLGGNQWQFSLVIDPSGAVLPNRTGPVTARFLLAIDSPSPVRSPEQVVEFRINRKAAAAPVTAPAPAKK